MRGMRPLSDAEVLAVANSFSGVMSVRNRCLFLLLYYLGWRISELLALNWGDVFLPSGEPKAYVTLARRHRKRRTEGRTDPVTDPMKAALAAWRDDFRKRGAVVSVTLPLFCSMSGRRISRQQAWDILTGAYEEAGLGRHGIGCHGIRKTHGMFVYRYSLDRLRKTGGGEAPMRAAQRTLGHSSVASTEHYLPVDESVVVDARHRMPDLSDPNGTGA